MPSKLPAGGQSDSREESGKEAEEENKAVLSSLGAREAGGGYGAGVYSAERDRQARLVP